MKTEPIDALRLLSETKLNPIHEIPRYKAGVIARIAFVEGQSSPRIKQLEWEFSNSYGTFYSSHTPISSYLIIRDCDNYFKPRSDKYTLQINGQGKLKKIDLDEAKEAAQTDFEKRIKECLL